MRAERHDSKQNLLYEQLVYLARNAPIIDFHSFMMAPLYYGFLN